MSLFTMIGKSVQGVISEVNKQKGNVTSQAVEPLNGFVNNIVGGVWTGPNADEFVNQIKQIIAELSDVGGIFGNLFQGLGGSMAAIQQGDKQATSAIGDLSNVFAKIF